MCKVTFIRNTVSVCLAPGLEDGFNSARLFPYRSLDRGVFVFALPLCRYRHPGAVPCQPMLENIKGGSKVAPKNQGGVLLLWKIPGKGPSGQQQSLKVVLPGAVEFHRHIPTVVDPKQIGGGQ